MAEILPFFAVPFGFAKPDDCGPLNRELRALFLARSAAGGEHANPRPLTQRNVQVFESNFGLFRCASGTTASNARRLACDSARRASYAARSSITHAP